MYLYRKGELANVMHAHVRDRIKTNFHRVRGAYPYDKSPDPFMLILDGYVINIPVVAVLKFKKQRWNLKTANIQTAAVKDFNAQRPVLLRYLPHIQLALGIKGFEDKVTNQPTGSNLIAGFTPDATWTVYDRKTISLPLEDGTTRVLSAITRNVAPTTNVVEMPQAPPSGAKRVRRKSQDEDVSAKARTFIKPEDQAQTDKSRRLRKTKE